MTSSAVSESLRQDIVGWLAEQESAMLGLLRSLVDMDSNSYDKDGIDRVGAELGLFLTRPGIRVTEHPIERHGDILRAETGVAGRSSRTILLMGHRDTVFPSGTAAGRPFRIEGARAYGPGVADMKSGLVMNAFVLAAFARFGGAPAPIVALVTGDEEIASPSSRSFIEAEARGAWVAFNAEAGRANGNVVVARRGCIFLRLEVSGRAAHSGVNFEDGRSAIGEIAHKIIALHRLSRPDAQVTVNVGLVSGGQSVNTVAPHASAEVDLRYYDPVERTALLDAVERIVGAPTAEGTAARWEIYGEFPPMNRTPRSDRLLALYRDAAAAVGLSLDGEMTAGAADSGFSAAVGTPTLCGLGPVGGRYHSSDEYMEVASLVPRAQALALTILGLTDRLELLGGEAGEPSEADAGALAR